MLLADPPPLGDGTPLELRRGPVEHEHGPHAVEQQSQHAPHHSDQMRVRYESTRLVSHCLEKLHEPDADVHSQSLAGQRVDGDAVTGRRQQLPQRVNAHRQAVADTGGGR